MCTVSYIPAKKGFYLTSNRDEDPERKTLPLQRIKLADRNIITAPMDMEKNGTWIASDKNGRVACLLNGAFVKHERKLPYKKSRGSYVIEAFDYNNFSDFIEKVDLNDVEPCTIILIDDYLQVLVWDGEKKHRLMYDKNVPQLWSSSTLYSKEEHAKKYSFFINSIKDKNPTPEFILEMHGLNKSTPFILEKEHVKTVSITQFVMNSKKSELTYHLLKTKKDEQKKVLH
ncbi:NRDE family protein [Abyssalbus ytuae]|uniref:NRDE family protein n=1 Tax=Abyssalbus ytuae TaxID=2926907 RepID=A0A9E6ZLZ9_9FLAO|nr:NRDE family protein [Abyssalbus ytuae]UOB18257.1 NRDE family protein [Abyssalbus ytuae]